MDQSNVVTKRVGLVLEVMLDRPKANAIDVATELGRANFALQYLVGRPSNILQACVGEQRDHYLFPCIRGEKTDCLAMTEPGAGSDLRSMQCRADVDGDDYVINGTKHFISHADIADFVILFAATGEEGIGGGGGNAVDHMLSASLDGVEFIVANTDAQALHRSGVSKVMQLGEGLRPQQITTP